MEEELKRQLEIHLDMYELNKTELQKAEKEYFGLVREDFSDFEKCECLRKQYKEAERMHDAYASAIADLVLENREKIIVQ